MALCFSQVPEKFNYQLVLRDQFGSVLQNEPATILISILQGSLQGDPVFIETHSITTNDFGLASLMIGSGAVISGSMNGIDWSKGPYFIKTWVNGIETGGSQLITVPYAMYAKRAQIADSGFSGNYEDLKNKPVLSKVSETGSYNDLLNKPELSDNYEGLLDIEFTNKDSILTNVLDLTAFNSASITVQWQDISDTTSASIQVFESPNAIDFIPTDCPIIPINKRTDEHKYFILAKNNDFYRFKISATGQLSGKIQAWAMKEHECGTLRNE